MNLKEIRDKMKSKNPALAEAARKRIAYQNKRKSLGLPAKSEYLTEQEQVEIRVGKILEAQKHFSPTALTRVALLGRKLRE
jgi:tRNA-binding EMAP/Myf-like protein